MRRQQAIRWFMVLATWALVLFFAFLWLRNMLASDGLFPPFTDANTYLAAGERLNAGHELYTIGPGDRYVLPAETAAGVALLSPPPIAVLWRPLAALPFGFALWNLALWMALLGTCAVLILRIGLVAAIGVAVLSPMIGEQLAAGNVAGFFPLLLVLAWRYQRAAGWLIGFMAVTKVAPATVAGWLIGTRNWRGVAAVAATGVIGLGLTVVFAGPDTITEYLALASRIEPSFLSMSTILSVPWASQAVLVGGFLAAIALGRRSAISFMVAVMAAVFGTPALYGSGLVTLLGALAPLAYPERPAGAGAEAGDPVPADAVA